MLQIAAMIKIVTRRCFCHSRYMQHSIKIVLADETDPSSLSTAGRAETFRQTREARRSEVTEDYVELIAALITERGEARPVDIAARLGVTQATVSKTIARLQREGLVVQQPYRAVFLTESGQKLADIGHHRHCLVVAFLLALGIDEETAHHDAEGIEHHVSQKTLDAFARFIREEGKGAVEK